MFIIPRVLYHENKIIKNQKNREKEKVRLVYWGVQIVDDAVGVGAIRLTAQASQ